MSRSIHVMLVTLDKFIQYLTYADTHITYNRHHTYFITTFPWYGPVVEYQTHNCDATVSMAAQPWQATVSR